MCDHRQLHCAGGAQPSSGEIMHIHFLSENIGSLFMDEHYSDVTLIVEGQRFPVHKVILASRSDYFRFE